jgi:phenylpropionate dioxygenase-like ring-hydroxylating dioxygenase large terminal subunit
MQCWLFVSHKIRFPNIGDYRSFEIAGFPFFVIRGRDDVIRAFHNVCRHRAYPVVKKESGCSNVISCRYVAPLLHAKSLIIFTNNACRTY